MPAITELSEDYLRSVRALLCAWERSLMQINACDISRAEAAALLIPPDHLTAALKTAYNTGVFFNRILLHPHSGPSGRIWAYVQLNQLADVPENADWLAEQLRKSEEYVAPLIEQIAAQTAVHTCPHCECGLVGLIGNAKVYDTDGEYAHVCDDCINDNSWKCDDCGCLYNTNVDSHTAANNDVICPDCWENYCECEECNEHFHTDNCVELHTSRRNTRTVCENCADNIGFVCADCGDRWHEDRSGGCNCLDESVCESCAESYFYCEGCSSTCHNDDYREDGYCQNCSRSSDDEDCDGIREYDCDVLSIIPCKLRDDVHYLGAELEFEVTSERRCVSDVVDEIDEYFSNFAIVKHDGSITRGGEIVTIPATLREQKKRWSRFLGRADLSGVRSHDTTTCGLHVHCSRKPLTELQIGKIVVFVNRKENAQFIRCIARRKSTYAKTVAGKKLTSGENRDRYEAVNLQNSSTIEFRIFRGTLKQESLFAALELCTALIAFCGPSARSISDCESHIEFCRYVFKNKNQYPFLHRYLSEKWNDYPPA